MIFNHPAIKKLETSVISQYNDTIGTLGFWHNWWENNYTCILLVHFVTIIDVKIDDQLRNWRGGDSEIVFMYITSKGENFLFHLHDLTD